MKLTVLHFGTLGSTNTEAAEQARRGADEGLCVVADEQTAGRGRQGREWSSKKGSGIYMSLVLRPKIDAKHVTLIPLLAAVAVHEVLRQRFALDADIKWPNDVLVRERKICGILSEALETQRGLAAILGIGMNIENDGLPDTATSIEAETGSVADRAEMVIAIAGEIAKLYDRLSACPGEIIDQWKQRSSYFEGKAVRVDAGTETFTGVTCGLEENGALRVRTPDGTIKTVNAGDVERLRTAEIELAA